MRNLLLLLAVTSFASSDASILYNKNVSIENSKNNTPKDSTNTNADDFQIFSDYYLNLNDEGRHKCPVNWHYFEEHCYRFFVYPKRTRSDAHKICQQYGADLFDEMQSVLKYGPENMYINYVTKTLRIIDIGGPWYFGGNYSLYKTKYYKIPVFSLDESESTHFICEGQTNSVRHLIDNEYRSFTYGLDTFDPKTIPMGPFFFEFESPRDTFNQINNIKDKNIYFNCFAYGFPAPTYKWFREDRLAESLIVTDISTIEDSRYELNKGKLTIYFPHIDNNNNTMYYCTATNKFGIIRSASVKVYDAFSEKNNEESNGTGVQYRGKVIFCDKTPFYPYFFTFWDRDNNFIPPSGDKLWPEEEDKDSRVFVSHDGGLYFSSLDQEKDSGSYKCNIGDRSRPYSDRITNKEGPLLGLVVLPIPLSPSNTTHQLEFPNNFPKVFPDKPLIDEEVRLECVAFGYPVPTYKWTKRNSDLPKKAILRSFNRVLIMTDLELEDEGEYVCEVENGRERISKSVFLKLQAEPYFTIRLTDKHADVGSEIFWKCEAFGIPDVNYTWWKNGVKLSIETLENVDKGRYLIQDNILTIKNLDPVRDPGMYQCAAKNQLRTRYSTGELRVLILKPSFKKSYLPFETYGLYGRNVTLNCNPTAAPKPKFTWKKNGVIIGANDKKNIYENQKLMLLNFSKDDEGIYTCKAENQYGADETSTRLVLLSTPRFIQKPPSHYTAKENQDITLDCKAKVDKKLAVKYLWSYKSKEIREVLERGGDLNYVLYGLHHFNLYGRPDKFKIEDGRLTIYKTSYRDSGDYICSVKTSLGQMSAYTQVLVVGLPDPPENIEIIDIQRSAVILEWTDGNPHGSPIMGYIITYWNNYNHSNSVVNINVTDVIKTDDHSGRKRATLEIYTEPWHKYAFQVHAFNALGVSKQLERIHPVYATATSPPDKPYEAPSHVSGGGKDIGELNITWEPLPQKLMNGPGIHYKIFWRRSGSGDGYQSLLLQDENISSYAVKVSAETFYTPYDVKVQACNDLGTGPESEPVTLYSGEHVPLVVPGMIVAIPLNSSSLKVIWNKVEESLDKMRGKLKGYMLKYWNNSHGEYKNDTYYFTGSKLNSAIIGGLQPYTDYYVKVMAVNSAGNGPASEPSPMRSTFAKEPQTAPECVDVRVLTLTTVQVTWCEANQAYWTLYSDDFKLREESLIGYKVRLYETYKDIVPLEEIEVPVNGKLERNFTIVNPEARSDYYFVEVLAYSKGGDGPAKRSSQFGMTMEYYPEKPTMQPTTIVPPKELPKCSLGQDDHQAIQSGIKELKEDLKKDTELLRGYMVTLMRSWG